MNPKSINTFLSDAAKKYGNENAIISIIDDSYYSFNKLHSDANKVAKYIVEEFGYSPGVIAIFDENSYRFIVLMFAGLIANKTIVPLPTNIDKDTISYIMHDCKPILVCHSDNLSSDIIDTIESSNFLCKSSNSILQNIFETVVDKEHEIPKDFINNDLVFVIYTSGSTGKPRGVMCPYEQILFAIKSINSILNNTPEDRILCGLPFSFDYGLYQILLSIHSGATIVLAPGFDNPLAIPSWLYKYEITGFPGIPSLLKLLNISKLLSRTSLQKLRYITSTGDVLHVETIDELQSQVPATSIYVMYGLTECKRVSILKPDEYISHKGSVGLPIPGTTIRITNEDGVEVTSGEIGELVVYGNHIMKGYLNNNSDTLKRFKNCPINNEICLYTGDLFSKDENNYLYFKGRKQGFIKTKGKRISPISIEILLRNIPEVNDAVVVGVPHNVDGESLFLFITLNKNATITPHLIADFSRRKLPVPIKLTHISIVNSGFPVNNNGKTDRVILKKKAEKILVSLV